MVEQEEQPEGKYPGIWDKFVWVIKTAGSLWVSFVTLLSGFGALVYPLVKMREYRDADVWDEEPMEEENTNG